MQATYLKPTIPQSKRPLILQRQATHAAMVHRCQRLAYQLDLHVLVVARANFSILSVFLDIFVALASTETVAVGILKPQHGLLAAPVAAIRFGLRPVLPIVTV